MRAGLAMSLLAAFLSACAPRLVSPGAATGPPALADEALVMADGARLPLYRWLPADKPRAVILALHGFNDYANAFAEPAAHWAREGIAVYAYDQRGFGAAPHPGRWAGTAALVDDLEAAAALLGARHRDAPLFLLGDSMGGAVVMAAMAGPEAPAVRGVVLAAPAVWGRPTMGVMKRVALWLAAHTVPWLEVSGRGLAITPSDNVEMLRRQGADPLVLKQARIDTIWGVVNLMDAAFESAPALTLPALILYGEKDEVIPKRPTRLMIARLPPVPPAAWRAAIYPDGYHMILRDLAAEAVLDDVAYWITGLAGLPAGTDGIGPLPSGADARGLGALAAE